MNITISKLLSGKSPENTGAGLGFSSLSGPTFLKQFFNTWAKNNKSVTKPISGGTGKTVATFQLKPTQKGTPGQISLHQLPKIKSNPLAKTGQTENGSNIQGSKPVAVKLNCKVAKSYPFNNGKGNTEKKIITKQATGQTHELAVVAAQSQPIGKKMQSAAGKLISIKGVQTDSKDSQVVGNINKLKSKTGRFSNIKSLIAKGIISQQASVTAKAVTGHEVPSARVRLTGLKSASKTRLVDNAPTTVVETAKKAAEPAATQTKRTRPVNPMNGRQQANLITGIKEVKGSAGEKKVSTIDVRPGIKPAAVKEKLPPAMIKTALSRDIPRTETQSAEKSNKRRATLTNSRADRSSFTSKTRLVKNAPVPVPVIEKDINTNDQHSKPVKLSNPDPNNTDNKLPVNEIKPAEKNPSKPVATRLSEQSNPGGRKTNPELAQAPNIKSIPANSKVALTSKKSFSATVVNELNQFSELREAVFPETRLPGQLIKKPGSNQVHRSEQVLGNESQQSTVQNSGNSTQATGTKSVVLPRIVQQITQTIIDSTLGTTTQTNFKIDGGKLGSLEIRFQNEAAHSQATILVESETARTAIKNIINEISENLVQKGIVLTSLDVQISQNQRKAMAATGKGNRGSKRNKHDEESSAVDDSEIINSNRRDYGYNTIEVIA